MVVYLFSGNPKTDELVISFFMLYIKLTSLLNWNCVWLLGYSYIQNLTDVRVACFLNVYFSMRLVLMYTHGDQYLKRHLPLKFWYCFSRNLLISPSRRLVIDMADVSINWGGCLFGRCVKFLGTYYFIILFILFSFFPTWQKHRLYLSIDYTLFVSIFKLLINVS